MKTDELKDTIRKSLQDCIDYGMGYVAGRHNLPSIPKEERNKPNVVCDYMQAIEVAIAALEQPVYHYLPEVPEDGEEVIGYSDTYGIEVLKFFKKDNAFMDAQLYETTGVYAWTRIPPKPPVKKGGQDVT